MAKNKTANKFRHLKWPKVSYMTYVLSFPDGDQWVKQSPFVHALEFELNQMIREKKTSEWKNRAMALWKTGECWWKDNLGAEHLIILESHKRKEKWGITKAGLGSISTETTYEAPNE